MDFLGIPNGDGLSQIILVKVTAAQPQEVARVVCPVITYYTTPDASGILGDLF